MDILLIILIQTASMAVYYRLCSNPCLGVLPLDMVTDYFGCSVEKNE